MISKINETDNIDSLPLLTPTVTKNLCIEDIQFHVFDCIKVDSGLAATPNQSNKRSDQQLKFHHKGYIYGVLL